MTKTNLTVPIGGSDVSLVYVITRMEELGIDKDGGSVCFGQLLGMCDHVSLTLGEIGCHSLDLPQERLHLIKIQLDIHCAALVSEGILFVQCASTKASIFCQSFVARCIFNVY